VPVAADEPSAAVELSFAGPASAIEVAVADEVVATVGEAEVAAVVRFELPGPGTIRVNSMGLGLTEYSEGLELASGEPDPGPADVEPRDVLGFSGGAVLLRSDALARVGVFDPHWFAYYEDLDLGWRMRRDGWRIVCAPASVVHHLRHGTGGPRAAFFHLANTRNWLLTVLRNGSPRQIATAWRYGLARGWFASGKGRDRVVAVAWLRIWLAVAWAAPGVLLQRLSRRPVGAEPTDRVGGPFLVAPPADGGRGGPAVRRSPA
jgi:GT2 family glycosyltransferase